MNINQVCAKYNFSPVYVRRSILQGKLKCQKISIGNNLDRWEITDEDVRVWRSSVIQKTKRTDGRSKFVIYANENEFDHVQDLLKSSELPTLEKQISKKAHKLA